MSLKTFAAKDDQQNNEKQQQIEPNEQKDNQDEETEEEELQLPEGFEPVPASEPNLTLIPKKSALKGMGGQDSKPSTPISRDKNENHNHSHVNFSHVDEITTPHISHVIHQASPKPSPKSTPISSSVCE